jgi:hypothetical protein
VCALLKLPTLISVHIIGCRKTKLSMERKMFPVCGPHKYSCISVDFRHLRNFPGVFRRFPDISGGFSEISGGFPNEKIKEQGCGDHGWDRTHNLRITDLILYLPATDAL